MAPKRARIKRGGKDLYLPVRTSDAERTRDQELLNAIDKKVSLEEAQKAVEEIRQQREEELTSSVVEEKDGQVAKRARIKRGGKDLYLPLRTSDGERARDQELLNAIGNNVSLEEAQKAMEEIRQQREEELTRSVER